MTSLADLRAVPFSSRPEARLDVCLDGATVARMGELTSALAAFQDAVANGLPVAQSDRHAAQAAAAEREALSPKILAASGTLTLRATPSDKEWRAFVDANPIRPEDTPMRERDMRVAGGIVNADALLAELGKYVYAWNDEPLGADDWVKTFASVGPGDRNAIARAIVGLYEAPRDFSRRWLASQETPPASNASSSPETSASPTSDSMAGNPEPSSVD